MLNVEAVKKSNIIVISCEASSPELAQAIVGRLVDSYLDFHVRLNRPPRGHKFLADRTLQQRDQLAHTEKELQILKSENGLVSLEGQRQVMVARLGRLQDDLLQTTSQLAAAQAEARLLRDRLGGASKTQVTAQGHAMPNQALDAMRAQLYALQLKSQDILFKYPPEHPEVQQIRKQVSAAQELLAKEEATLGPSRMFEETQLALLRQEPQVASLQAKADSLRDQLAHEQSELKRASTKLRSAWRSCSANWTFRRPSTARPRKAWSKPSSTRPSSCNGCRTSASRSRPPTSPRRFGPES